MLHVVLCGHMCADKKGEGGDGQVEGELLTNGSGG